MSADVHNEMSMIKIYTVHVNRVKSLKDIKLKKISYIFFLFSEILCLRPVRREIDSCYGYVTHLSFSYVVI